MRSDTNNLLIKCDIFGVVKAGGKPLEVEVPVGSYMYDFIIKSTPNIVERSKQIFDLSDPNFTDTDYSFVLVACFFENIIKNKPGELDKMTEMNPNWRAELYAFFVKKIQDFEMKAVSVKTKKEFQRLVDINDMISDYFLSIATSLAPYDQTTAIYFMKMELKLGKKLTAALSNAKGIPDEFKNKKITDSNVKIVDHYLFMGKILFHDKTQDDLSSLSCFVQADALLAYTHANGTSCTRALKYCIESYLCALSIRTGNIAEANRYAQKLLKHKSEIIKDPEMVMSEVEALILFNAIQLLADAHYENGNYAEALKWYEAAVNTEKNTTKKKQLEENIAKIATKYAALGQEAYNQNNYVTAISYYEDAIQIEKDLAKKKKFEVILSMIKVKADVKQKEEITVLAQKFTNITVDINNKAGLIIVHSAKGDATYPLSSSLDELEKNFALLDEYKNTQAPVRIISNPNPAVAAVPVASVDENLKAQTTESTSTEKKKKTLYIGETKASTAKDTQDNQKSKVNLNNNNNSTEQKDPKQDEVDDEKLGRELFGEFCKDEPIYPLRSSYIGKNAVHFALFRPKTTSGLGSKLTTETIDAHRACLAKEKFGPNEAVRQTGAGLKTWISSDAQAGDIRIASRGDFATVKRNGVTYHLVVFEEVHNHGTQKKKLY